MTAASPSQGGIGIERMCQLVGVSRCGYYRRWQRSAPRQEESGLRDAIQRLALKHRHYGYRRIGALLRREGWQANHKRVLRLMREDNLLCLRQAPVCADDDKFPSRLVRRPQPDARHGAHRPRSALGG
jgi:transposase InsO family protein